MGHPYDITFIFYKCHRSWAGKIPDKHECGLKYLTYIFAKSKFPVMEKLTNGALVTPTPGLLGKDEEKNGARRGGMVNGHKKLCPYKIMFDLSLENRQ